MSNKSSNKTRNYLIPGLLNGHGERFTKYFKNLLIVNYYFADEKFLLKSQDERLANSICVSIHRLDVDFMNYEYYIQELSYKWLKENNYILHTERIDSFINEFNYDIVPTELVVFKFPSDVYPDALKEFPKGNYKKMYPISDAIELFYRTDEYHLMVDSAKVSEIYINKVNEKFNTRLTMADIKGKVKNMDLPPTALDEIFRFRTYYNSDKHQNLNNYLNNMARLKGKII